MTKPGQIKGGRRTDKYIADALKRARSGARSVAVGFFETARYPDGTKAAFVAAVNEFGTNDGRIPERPFLRQSIEEAKDELAPLVEQLTDPETLRIDDRLPDAVGTAMTNIIQRRITALTDPPNAPATVARKGSSNPLIDTGFLRRSVTHRVGKPKQGG
ncbi:MAG: hypothetical protein F4X36_16065 [Gammaproteobacteria bacterium]|nr:hypothetical protein [Gammaproteobacteria bacterium]